MVDYEGYFAGATLAEKLRNDGYEVEFVTSHDAVAPFCDQTLEGLPARRLLHKLGVRAHRASVVQRITPAGIELEGEFGARSNWPSTASCWSPSGSPTMRSTAS